MKAAVLLLGCSLVACKLVSDLGHEREPAIVTSTLVLASDGQERELGDERAVWADDPTASCEVDGTDNEHTGAYNRSFAFAMAADERDPVAFGVAIELNERGVWQSDIGLYAQGQDAWVPADDCLLELGEWDYEARFFAFSVDCTFTREGAADIVVVGDLRAERCFDRSATSIELAKSIVAEGAQAALELGRALVEDPAGFAKTIALLPLYAAGGH
ncbi:hypothetical protein SAMN02745121_05878 [Nannocystis exedens]|uniref:Lipoprotein n=1 Tax=Nannocystis exedens TaxID=54 RepID=A0A1I2E3Y8_9BACT|nr:hypothetical protein [Nannocystis exedens]PCC69233.1 hypothetical protein NAEX_02255 [Nannocystis exedens]SFE86920.1 hypothetical protein SAMN02745121_05878 [Nannocystis exedens]